VSSEAAGSPRPASRLGGSGLSRLWGLKKTEVLGFVLSDMFECEHGTCEHGTVNMVHALHGTCFKKSLKTT